MKILRIIHPKCKTGIGIILFFAISFASPATGKGRENENNGLIFGKNKPSVIQIATEEYPPYTSEFIEFNGIDCKIVKEAFKVNGIQVKYIFLPGARSYELTKAGKMDGTLPWARRKNRENFFFYSDPVIKIDNEHFYYLKGFKFEWDLAKQNYQTLKGLYFGAISGYNYGENFQEAEKNGIIRVVRSSDIHKSIRMLLKKRIDIVIGKERVVDYALKSRYTKDQIAQLEHRTESVSSVIYDFLLFSKKRKNSLFFLKAFNNGLKKIQANGVYNQILKIDFKPIKRN